MKIFIVEDETSIRIELINFLKKYGYSCDYSSNFQNILQEILDAESDLILLDINLPYMDGFQLCKEIRKQSDIPIIVLTSRDTELDELMSLNLGADDFITKPYNPQILLARIQNNLNRTYEQKNSILIEHNGLTLDFLKGQISYAGKTKKLTKNEIGILRLLMINKGNIIPRDAIIDEIWQSEEFIDENTLNVNIVRLRKTLSEIGLPNYIETRRGMGYSV
ncbi:TPA: response regulator transcription factor [Streptococcus agalactiae]|nr:response regulator transcription factor [Streptococcus agalactiae]HEQ4179284.1 response regulator transcription factor [Streptococcus pyogenes]